MGLDMYLYKKHYVQNWEHNGKEKQFSFLIKKGGKKCDYINDKKITYVTEQVTYWRKANAIHQWFIENCADGDGSKTEMSVSQEQIKELHDTCVKVLDSCELIDGKINNGQQMKNGKWVDIKIDGKYIKDPTLAEELLPTESGFFFGSTDYDEYYVEDLKNTIKELEPELKEVKGQYPDYEYNASW